MFFSVRSFPKCEYHLFLSHSREDHEWLVRPAYEYLNQHKIASFLDVEDYPIGRDSRSALKGELLLSRHVVFFITEAMLNNPRGWCILELAYSEILQSMMQFPSGYFCNYILPLFFIPQSDSALPRSVWQLLRDRGVFAPAGCSREEASRWANQQIIKFLRKEQAYKQSMSRLAIDDLEWSRELRKIAGLHSRATKFHPNPIKLPGTP